MIEWKEYDETSEIIEDSYLITDTQYLAIGTFMFNEWYLSNGSIIDNVTHYAPINPPLKEPNRDE